MSFQLPTKIFDSQGKVISLGSKIGSGGEGSVFEITDRSEMVVKLYHKPLSTDRISKLSAMVQVKNDQLLKFAAWPTGLLYNDNQTHKIIGILMPKITGYKEIHSLYGPKSRLQEFPSANWPFLIHTATNLARAFNAVHFYGQVIGDVNHSNILVSHQALVKLIDCDSFQISNNNKKHLCEVGVLTHQPPEMQQYSSFRGIIRTANHDNFGLAVLVFQLLFMGRHPFAGQYLGQGDMPIEKAIKEQRFAYSLNSGKTQMKPPPGTLSLNAVSPMVTSFFEKAFSNGPSQLSRPTSKEWVDALDSFSKELQQCAYNNGHHYYKTLANCPWCEIEKRSGIFLFSSVVVFSTTSNQQFQLEAVWSQITQIHSPGPAPSLIDYKTLDIRPSEDALKFAKKRRLYKLSAVILVIVVCIVVIKYTIFGWKLLITGLITYYFAFSIYNNKNQEIHIEKRYKDIKYSYSSMLDKWNNEAGDAGFNKKLEELTSVKNEYLDLKNLYQSKLQQLKATLRQKQLDKFLDRYRIDNAKIDNIGAGRKATLQSFGIETALDVKAQTIRTIPGFGHKLTGNVLAWRKGLESQFVFDSSKGIDPGDIDSLNKEMQNHKLKLERLLLGGANNLKTISHQTIQKRTFLKSEIEKYLVSLAQAEMDYKTIS
ncbi:MAG: hypothetical protein H6Q69_1986 [Firmicutes bacterium]|nr:hypothetical protein [Bacillota bacterium]